MRLSAAGRDGSTTGEVLNHMQLDAQRVGDLMLFINVLWSGILADCGVHDLAVLLHRVGLPRWVRGDGDPHPAAEGVLPDDLEVADASR
jgi:hypothetical protein